MVVFKEISNCWKIVFSWRHLFIISQEFNVEIENVFDLTCREMLDSMYCVQRERKKREEWEIKNVINFTCLKNLYQSFTSNLRHSSISWNLKIKKSFFDALSCHSFDLRCPLRIIFFVWFNNRNFLKKRLREKQKNIAWRRTTYNTVKLRAKKKIFIIEVKEGMLMN
jgi:hypothetical protein